MKIFLYDEFNPEDMAMLQALYSRSALSVEEHAEKVRASGSGKFMERYYVGYGHASIADCGSTTMFFEGVSMLAAKAIQDWPLYSGQETSSRYIDMSKQARVDPIGTAESKAIQERWMSFYTDMQGRVEEHLKQKYPRKADEDEGVYGRAIKARVFDSLRAFLPAGITTQLSWHSNLRQAWDKIALLRYYPLAEVRDIAAGTHDKLKEKYAHSFGHKLYEAQEAYWKMTGEKYTYYKEKKYAGDFSFHTVMTAKDVEPYRELLDKRPIKTNLPHFVGDAGQLTFEFLLDFGSFRDLQRHRNGICRMPLLTTEFGFEGWYLEQLPADLRAEAETLIEEQKKVIETLPGSPEEKQYYVAMGFNVTAKVTYGLPAALYVIELRSGRLVHPTLRKVMHKAHEALAKHFPDLPLHTDLELDDWDVRRGLQDIKEKPQSA